MIHTADILYKTSLTLGEGAIWHPRWKKFLYVDIEGKKVGCIDPVTKETKEQFVGKRIGTVVPAMNDKLIIALQGSIEELDFETGEKKMLTTIEADKQDNRCNEGKCDAAGRLWIGTMNINAKLNEGVLYCFDGKQLHKKIEHRSVSNGICWSNDNSTMYYIDSFDYNIKAYDFDVTTGNITNEHVAVKIEEGEGKVADGMCIDTAGNLWVAIWGGGCVNCYNPLTGTLIEKIMVAALNVTACAFGGENMQQLFITTARAGLSDEELKQYPLSGSLFSINVEAKGCATNYFNQP